MALQYPLISHGSTLLSPLITASLWFLRAMALGQRLMLKCRLSPEQRRLAPVVTHLCLSTVPIIVTVCSIEASMMRIVTTLAKRSERRHDPVHRNTSSTHHPKPQKACPTIIISDSPLLFVSSEVLHRLHLSHCPLPIQHSSN